LLPQIASRNAAVLALAQAVRAEVPCPAALSARPVATEVKASWKRSFSAPNFSDSIRWKRGIPDEPPVRRTASIWPGVTPAARSAASRAALRLAHARADQRVELLARDRLVDGDRLLEERDLIALTTRESES
jgi:hypothetical protein